MLKVLFIFVMKYEVVMATSKEIKYPVYDRMLSKEPIDNAITLQSVSLCSIQRTTQRPKSRSNKILTLLERVENMPATQPSDWLLERLARPTCRLNMLKNKTRERSLSLSNICLITERIMYQ
jgi:hypothetical protein